MLSVAAEDFGSNAKLIISLPNFVIKNKLKVCLKYYQNSLLNVNDLRVKNWKYFEMFSSFFLAVF